MPALAILWSVLIQKRFSPSRSWVLIVLFQAVLVGSDWAPLETGEEEGARVERIVAERHVETHEEAGERFLLLAGIGLLASTAGLLRQRMGAVGRVAGTLATFVVLAAGVSVGHSGGDLG